MKTKLIKQEKLIKKGPANLQKFLWTKGGHLYITNKRIVFESHAFNINVNKEVAYDIANIVNVKRGWTKVVLFPIAPNSFRITMKNGQQQGFVVYKRKQWIDDINQLIKN